MQSVTGRQWWARLLFGPRLRFAQIRAPVDQGGPAHLEIDCSANGVLDRWPGRRLDGLAGGVSERRAVDLHLDVDPDQTGNVAKLCSSR